MQYINLDLDGVFADFEANFRNIVGFNYHDDPKGAWKILDKVDMVAKLTEEKDAAKTALGMAEHRIRCLEQGED